MKKGSRKLTPSETREIVQDYIRTGNYSETGRTYDKDSRTIQNIVERFQLKNQEEYNKLFNSYIAKSEQEFIRKSTTIINKIGDKIEEQVEFGDNTIAQLSTSLGILYDKRQLSQGKSTNNSQVIVKLSSDLQELSK